MTLCCEISKAASLVQWKKGDDTLSSGEKYQMRQSGSKLELLIRKTLPEDSGTYSCVCDDIKTTATIIINGEHRCMTRSTVMEIFWHNLHDIFHSTAIPVSFKQKLKNQELVEESSLTLRCELSKAGVAAEWRRDAQLLKEGDKYQMKQEGRVAEMTVRHLSLTDAGEYSCCVGTAVTSADIKVRGRLFFRSRYMERPSEFPSLKETWM